MILFMCPMGHRLAVPDDLVGQRGRCPVCRQRVYVPELDSQPARHGKQADPGPFMIELEPEPAPPPQPMTGPAPAWAMPGAIAPPPPPRVPGAMAPHAPGDSHVPHGAAAPPAMAIPPHAPPPGPWPGAAPAMQPPGMPHAPPAMPPSQFAAIPSAMPLAHVPMAVLERDPPAGARPPASLPAQTAWLLAVAMAVVVLFCAAPALKHVNLLHAPGWARIVLLLAVVQLIYVVWMAVMPDWSTVWIGMLVFAGGAAVYGLGLAVALATPSKKHMILGMDEVKQTAAGWCVAVMVLSALLVYVCGRISAHWRRAYEAAKAERA